MAQALRHAHGHEVLHRDLKPSNVLLPRDGRLRVVDFGLAKVVEEVRNHTTAVAGTPYYMSPEQTLGKNIDHRTDIYSLGVALFEMAAGIVPFKEGNIPYHHVHTPPPNVLEVSPDLPKPLAAIIHKCLEKDPRRRYASAGELADDLGRFLAGRPIEARRASALERAARFYEEARPAQGATLRYGLEAALREAIPEVAAVVAG